MAKRRIIAVNCVKNCFLVCATFLWLTAAGIFGVGVWTLASKNDYEALLGSVMYVTSAGMMIAAGIFAMFVCIFGIIGAIRDSRFMILGFFVMITIVFCMELVAGILAYVYRGEVRTEVSKNLNVTIASKFGVLGHEKETKAVSQLQRTYQCCGDVDFSSWKNSAWRKLNSNISGVAEVPDSCCISPSEKCGVRTHPSNVWRNDLLPLGCFTKLERYLDDHLFIMGIVGICVGIVQLSCMALSMWLYRLVVDSYY
ncbi:CD151 antigen-like [Rhopilema esculentum]|uniref:CD151 antigen-like n=1 Tax=Rhopilema esculentum TaxID=499914 RepID=UPI0031D8F8D4